jgi:hypothetical protein
MTYDKVQEMRLSEGQKKAEEARKNSKGLAGPKGSTGGQAVSYKGKSRGEIADMIANDPRIPWDQD